MNSKLNINTFFFFNDTATTEIYTLSLHDALPIFGVDPSYFLDRGKEPPLLNEEALRALGDRRSRLLLHRSEEHTSELQSRQYLVCRLLLEKKKNTIVLTQNDNPYVNR